MSKKKNKKDKSMTGTLSINLIKKKIYMTCKLCQTNNTDSTSGICDECNNSAIKHLTDPFQEALLFIVRQKMENLKENPMYQDEFKYLLELIKRMETILSAPPPEAGQAKQ